MDGGEPIVAARSTGEPRVHTNTPDAADITTLDGLPPLPALTGYRFFADFGGGERPIARDANLCHPIESDPFGVTAFAQS